MKHDILRKSSVSDFNRCKYLYYLKWVKGYRESNLPHYVYAGAAFAEGVNIYRKERWEKNSTWEEAKKAGTHALIKSYGDVEPLREGDSRDWAGTLRAFHSYLDVYKDDHLVPVKIGDKAMIECSVALPIDETEFLYCGRLDALVEEEGKSGCGVVDEKTTTSISKDLVQGYMLSSQFRLYAYAMQQHGLDANRAYIRVVGIQKTQTKHEEIPIIYTQKKLDDAWSLLKDLSKEIRECEEKNYWPRALDYMACRRCAFSDVCFSDSPEVWLEGYNQTDPMEVYREQDV